MAQSKSFLGSLEQSIMDVVWRSNQATVRDVCRTLKVKRPVAYTTVMTVMNRLVDHGCLRRRPGMRGAFVYTPRHSQEEFFAAASKNGIHQLLGRYGDVALVQFMETLDRVPNDKLERLRRQVRHRRRS